MKRLAAWMMGAMMGRTLGRTSGWMRGDGLAAQVGTKLSTHSGMQTRAAIGASLAALALGAAMLAPALCSAADTGERSVTLATTTSTDNSGLLASLLPPFEAQSGLRVKVIAVGSGKALELARRGDADVVLVHARAAEDQFVAAGYALERRDVMHNDFVLLGPPSDPAAIKGSADLLAALRKLVASGATFVSRGDNSGTEQMEQSYWQLAGVRPQGKLYLAAGQGMGEVLAMAGQLQAYTLCDRGTYAAYRQRVGLDIVFEGDARLFNPYGIMAVNPARVKGVNYAGANALVNWITSAQGRERIAAFRVDGQQLFFPAR